jgi:hypothetical protein
MPWELGYFDGLRGERIAVMPLVEAADESFRGQEYLGLYSLVESLPTRGGGSGPFATRQSAGRREYITLKSLAAGTLAYRTG